MMAGGLALATRAAIGCVPDVNTTKLATVQMLNGEFWLSLPEEVREFFVRAGGEIVAAYHVSERWITLPTDSSWTWRKMAAWITEFYRNPVYVRVPLWLPRSSPCAACTGVKTPFGGLHQPASRKESHSSGVGLVILLTFDREHRQSIGREEGSSITPAGRWCSRLRMCGLQRRRTSDGVFCTKHRHA